MNLKNTFIWFFLFRTSASIDDLECLFDGTETLGFKIIFFMGVTFVTISAIISFYIDKIERKLLLSE